MNYILIKKKLGDKSGFSLGYVFVIMGAVLIIGAALLAASLSENKQTVISTQKIASNYLAESGAEIAQLAFKKYIQLVNNEVTENLTWLNLSKYMDYKEFLKFGPLKQPASGNEVVFHLNLSNSTNDYFLSYGDNPIGNDLGDGNSVQTAITLIPMPVLTSSQIGTTDSRSYPFKFMIKSEGHKDGALTSKSTTLGEGTVFVQFFPGSYTRYALFTEINRNENNVEVWFETRTIFTGPVHSNGTMRFIAHPVFYGRVSSVDKAAWFWNGNGYTHSYLEADSNPPHDRPVFHQGFKRGVVKEYMPTTLQELRKLNLAGDIGGEHSGKDYHFPVKNNELSGGLYLPKPTSMLLIADGNKQIIRTIISPAKELDFIFDYTNKKTTVYDRKTQSNVEVFNSLPNGTIFVDSNITSLSGIVQKNARLTIAAKSSIIINNHIKYEEDPRVYPEARNILGILSENSDVIVPNTLPFNDLVVQATIMAAKGCFRAHDYYDFNVHKGTLKLLGGVISYYYGSFGRLKTDSFGGQTIEYFLGYGREFVYDERMADPYKAPLGFPKTESMQWLTMREDGMDYLDLLVWKKQ